jgi:hypothetical protein
MMRESFLFLQAGNENKQQSLADAKAMCSLTGVCIDAGRGEQTWWVIRSNYPCAW